jgi:hypothetical protein
VKPPGRGNRSRSSLDLFPTWCLRQYEFGRCFGLFMDYGKEKEKENGKSKSKSIREWNCHDMSKELGSWIQFG